MKNILNYRAREEIFFLDYLPDELFINLTESQRISFRKLRENHLLIQKAKSEIEDLNNEIKEIKEQIKKIKHKIEGTTERPGYMLKMQSAETELTSTSWKTIPTEIVKEEIKLLYGSYVRYFIWKKNWDEFFKEKHGISSVKDWALDMGKDYLRW